MESPHAAEFLHFPAVLLGGASLAAVTLGIWNLPVDGWIRAFLIVSAMFLVTSAFTLAKVVRERNISVG